MKRIASMILLAALTAVASLSALTVKLGSRFPENSPWDTTLRRMAAEWAEITNGQVRMRIYPGGIAGSEGDMVRKMRINQLDAAVIAAFGMRSIVSNTFVMSLPGILESEEELDYVIEEFAPRFDQDFIDAGFRVLTWSKSGWAYFFAKNPARNPDMLRRERLAVNSTDEELAANFKALRFNVVPTALNEVIVGLQSGMLSAFYGPPMIAAAYQLFPMAPYMIDFPISPVLGGLVISERTWRRIPERYHQELQEATRSVARDFHLESERLNAQAMDVMTGMDLSVVDMTDSERRTWYNVMTSGHELVIGPGKWIDNDVYADFMSLLEDLR